MTLMCSTAEENVSIEYLQTPTDPIKMEKKNKKNKKQKKTKTKNNWPFEVAYILFGECYI